MLNEPTVEESDWLAKRRAQEEKRAQRFPGFPSYLDDSTLHRLETIISEEAEVLLVVLEREFGHRLTQGIGPKTVEYWLRSVAKKVAHETAGHMVSESAKQANQATNNMINALFAGIEIAKRENTDESS